MSTSLPPTAPPLAPPVVTPLAPPVAPPPAPGIGRIIAGLAFMVVWALAHVVLFYLMGVGGILTQAFVLLLKAFLFPGTSQTAGPAALEWTVMLTAGTSLAGAAGVPAGLAIIWRHRRKMLMRYFWLAMLAGIVCELIAFGTFVSGALSTP